MAVGGWKAGNTSNFGGAGGRFVIGGLRPRAMYRGQVEQTLDRFRGTGVRRDLREEGSSERWKHASLLLAQRRVQSSRESGSTTLSLAEELNEGHRNSVNYNLHWR